MTLPAVGAKLSSPDHRIFHRILDIDVAAPEQTIFVDSAGKVGIGTSSPQSELEVGGNPGTSVGGFASGNLHVTGQSALVNANAVITGHNLFGGNKQLWYLGSVSSSNDNIAFINRQNGSLGLHTNNLARLTIEAGGDVGIGLTNPTGRLHIDQSSTTAAEPVLFLDQADVSEEIVEISSTAGVGNAIELVGAKNLTVTEFIKVTINGNTRFLQAGTIA